METDLTQCQLVHIFFQKALRSKLSQGALIMKENSFAVMEKYVPGSILTVLRMLFMESIKHFQELKDQNLAVYFVYRG